jgi:SH3-like domain-containing protein
VLRYVGAAGRAALAALALASAFIGPVAAAEFRSANDDAVLLYDAPSAQSKKLFIVSRGYPLEVVVVVTGWVKVRDAAGALSWVEATKVSAKPRTVMVKVPTASIRVSADETAPVVFQAQQDVVLELTEVSGGWLRVRHRDGTSGFIRASQVWGV